MGFSKVFTSLAVAALACMAPSVSAQAKNLPWDGRGQDVTVATLDSKFMLHIFKQRQSGNGDPADYVTVDPKGRSSYNGDTGVINIAVDDKAIFGGQTTFRRSELVQQLNGASTTFFRASIKADKELVNKHKWQVFFPESHQWEVFVDMTLSPPEIQFLTESRVQWKTPFVTKTWYNFGIEVASSGITLYTSSGNAALAKSFSDNKATSGANQWELHFGLLTLSGTGAAPTMTGRDILSFNGVTVDTKASTSGGAGGADPAPAPAPDATPATPATRRPTTAPATDAPETPKPTSARTPRPTSAPVTAAPDAPSPAVTPAPKPASTPAPKPSSGTTPTKPNKCKAKRRRN